MDSIDAVIIGILLTNTFALWYKIGKLEAKINMMLNHLGLKKKND